jgi:hypothetical protein
MAITVEITKKTKYDMTINGVEFKDMEKVSTWENFSKYVGKDKEFLILVHDGSRLFGECLGDIFGDGGTYYLVGGSQMAIAKFKDSGM